MTITQSAIQTTISRAMPRSSGLVILFAAVHTVSDAVTNMPSEQKAFVKVSLLF